jgi:hypothetical protein
MNNQITDLGAFVYSDFIELLAGISKDTYNNINTLYEDQVKSAPKNQARIVFYQNNCLHTIRLNLDTS